MILNSRPSGVSRRAVLRMGASALAVGAAGLAAPGGAAAQSAAGSFSFDALSGRMRAAAGTPYAPPDAAEGFFTELKYDDYRNINFRDESALWAGPEARVVVHAYHPGWLFDIPVELYEVVDGEARALSFTTRDFEYYNDLAERVPAEAELPGVAGFRLNAPINTPGTFDEVVSFLGASYFRALGAGNAYGLSARGLAVNTAMSTEEEFPRFSGFWLQRPEPGSDHVVFFAALESASVTGAYRFALTPGETTAIDVTARLFFRQDVAQLGIAPLTSMFLFGPGDEGPFDDYRTRVHDSEALVVTTGGQSFFRALNNPPRLANSYVGAVSPDSFGLVQRHRDFDDYLDAHAAYERRPSLIVEPVGDWGPGAIRLIEIPSDLEANDNIVAFWVPEGDSKAGDEMEISYRLHWGAAPPGAEPDLARISRMLAGAGGVGGVEPRADRRKFVVDFEGGRLAELSDTAEVEPRVVVSNGTLEEAVLERIGGEDGLWRLVVEASADPGAIVELSASLYWNDGRLTETWLYQWLRE